MTIKATSKENDYSKRYVNYFQSWQMGTTNKLLLKGNLKRLLLPIANEEGNDMYDDTLTDITDVQWRVMMMNFQVLNQ